MEPMTDRELMLRAKNILGPRKFSEDFNKLHEMAQNGTLETYLNSLIRMPPPPNTKINTPKDKTNMQESIKQNVVSETLSNAKLQVGKVIYTNARRAFARFLPKFSLVEKLFVSKEKRQAAEYVAMYAILHLVRSKYDHYALDCLTAYLNHEMQSSILGAIASPEVLGALVAAPATK
jgi:hypothetical protein